MSTPVKRSNLDSLQAFFKKEEEKIFCDYFTFLKFQTISSEPEYKAQMLICVDWLDHYLKNMGFSTEIWQTPGHPTLFASYTKAGPDKPTLLIYNHYDVQPVDPLHEWKSSPFEASLRDGQIYARGAQDNKGQCFYTIQALRAILECDGQLPINIKLCIEGEEEVGSTGLSSILSDKKNELRADYLAVVDVGLQDLNSPAVTLGVRGLVTMDVEVDGSHTDLHSGSHGGIVFNPIHALVDVLSKLRDPSGKIMVPGFYDDVVELDKTSREQLQLTFDEKQYEKTFGAKAVGGEEGYSPLERAWIRPVIEINGISGGYSGSGFKTVIPAKASAKLSCRLVSDQNPEKIGKLVANFIENQAPNGVSVKVTVRSGTGKAVRASADSPIAQAFARSYEEIFQKPCGFIFEGGSIPIVPELAAASQSEVVLVGLALPDDQIHAPNERFGVDRFEKGFLLVARAIECLGKIKNLKKLED